MEIKAWKCEKTGKLFETELAFNEHKQVLARAEQVEQARAELEARLAGLRRAPFEQATSVTELFERLVGSYSQVVELMVKLGQATESALAHRLTAVRVEVLEFTSLDRNITQAAKMPSDAEGIVGDVYFDYLGPIAADYVEATAAFPLLNAGFTPWMVATSGDSIDSDRGHRQCPRRVNLVLEHMPHLAAAHLEYETIADQELDELLDQQKGLIARFEVTDPEYLQARQSQGDVVDQLLQLEATKKMLDARVQNASGRTRSDAIQAIPRLQRFFGLAKLLYVS